MASDLLQDTVSRIRAQNAARGRGSEVVIGVGADEPSNPGVVAVVHQGKLTRIVVPQSYMALDRATLEAIINAAIANAFFDWQTNAAKVGV